MWAQLIKMRVQEGKEGELDRMMAHLQAIEQPGSGLIRVTALRDQKDPAVVYVMPVFESEEKARVREQDPRRQEGIQTVQAIMRDMLAGTPEFVDLKVITEVIPPA